MKAEMNYQPYLQVHCQSPTSQRYNQSFAKELAKPTLRKIVFKKFPDPLRKIKNANTQTETDRLYSKMTMTEKLNIDNGLQRQMKRTPGGNRRYILLPG